jgi:hypothetical protein
MEQDLGKERKDLEVIHAEKGVLINEIHKLEQERLTMMREINEAQQEIQKVINNRV